MAAVGLMHLIGKDGLPPLLRAKGLKVEQVAEHRQHSVEQDLVGDPALPALAIPVGDLIGVLLCHARPAWQGRLSVRCCCHLVDGPRMASAWPVVLGMLTSVGLSSSAHALHNLPTPAFAGTEVASPVVAPIV